MWERKMSPNRRIVLNIIATCWLSLCALVFGLLCGRWALRGDCGWECDEFGVGLGKVKMV